MLWSVPLYQLLSSTVAAVLSEEGGGSFALPAVRADQGSDRGAAQCRGRMGGGRRSSTLPSRRAARRRRRRRSPAATATRCLAASSHFNGSRRGWAAPLPRRAHPPRRCRSKPAARPLLARVRLPVHAAPLLRHGVEERGRVRRLSRSFRATPAPRRAEDTAALAGLPADAVEPERLLYACSASTRSCMRWRAIDGSGAEQATARRSGDGPAGGAGGRFVLIAMTRAHVWALLAAVRSGPAKAAGARRPRSKSSYMRGLSLRRQRVTAHPPCSRSCTPAPPG